MTTIKKEELYGQNNRSVEANQKLHRQATRKALDLPMEDDVNISRTGIGWKELAVIGATILGGAGLWTMNQQPAATPAAQEWQITVTDEEGVEVEPIKPGQFEVAPLGVDGPE